MVKRFIAASAFLLACGGAELPNYNPPPPIDGSREDLLQIALPRLHAATGLELEDLEHLYIYEASGPDTVEACNTGDEKGVPGGCTFIELGVIVIHADLPEYLLEGVLLHEIIHSFGVPHVGSGIMAPVISSHARIDAETLWHLCQKADCTRQQAEFGIAAQIPPSDLAKSCSHAML